MGALDLVLGVLGKKKGDKGAPLIDLKAGYRTEEQEKAVFYFSDKNAKIDLKGCFSGLKGCFPKKPEIEKAKGCFLKKGKGCFSKRKYMPGTEYDALVQSIVQRLDPKNKGLAKLGLDESQVEKTINFANYVYDSNDANFYWRIDNEDDLFRSSVYQITYLFFTQAEIVAYQLTLNSDWEQHEEKTYEYHYKDITALSTETVQADYIDKGKKVWKTVKNEFVITVPGDSFRVALRAKTDAAEEDAIQGMKSLLREKKA